MKYLLEIFKLLVIAFLGYLIENLGSHRGTAPEILQFIGLVALPFMFYRICRIFESQVIQQIRRYRR